MHTDLILLSLKRKTPPVIAKKKNLSRKRLIIEKNS